MPPKKPKSPLSVETKEYHVFDPEDVKKSVEIAVKPKPNIEDLEKVEKKGKVVKKKTRKKNVKADKEKKSDFLKLKKDGYVLIITEKPQAAGKIAAALSDGKDKRIVKNKVSYYELERNGKKIVVSCAVGHLFSVSQNKKGSDYPEFDISWFPNFEVRKNDFTKSYYSVIERLVKGAGEIVVATDFDVEGEVIGYNIIRFIARQKDAKRMKFSSLTSREISESYDNAQDSIEWGQAIAGETRHFIDWLYGINLSRALMSAIKSTGKFRIMSIGRVQGPALKLIVDKEIEIKNFKSSKYWQIFITINDGKNKLELKHNKDITKKEELDKFKELEGREGIVETKKTKQKLNPPAPFDLTSLQTESYKFHGITPSQTLSIAQKLYLAGLISYPRTSSQKIPDVVRPLEILKKLNKNFPDLGKHAVNKKPVEGNKSDPAHPSIMPTGNFSKLEGQDERVYELIVRRFVSCFCENAELENKRVELVTDSLKFAAKGMEILKKGWMNVYRVKMDEKDVKDMNGKIKIEKVRVEEKETKPPKRFSPASIVSELEKRNLGTKCLTGDTKIMFKGKLTSIGDIFQKGKLISIKNGSEIREIKGNTVSVDNKNKALITDPKFISRRKIEKRENIIKVDTDLSSIKLTKDHLVYTTDQNDKIIELPIKDLSIKNLLVGVTKKFNEGDIIIKKSIFNSNYKTSEDEIKHKFASKNHKGILLSKFPIRWSTSLSWILGYYYGDGSYDGPQYNGSHSISFTTTEKKALSLLKENIKNIFGYEPYAYNLGTKYKVNCNSVMAYVLIKTFPELEGKNIMKIPTEFVGDFLRGFFDADGNVHLRPKGKTKIKGILTNSNGTPRVKFTLGNERLINWVSDLLHKLDIVNKINKGKVKLNGKIFNCWTILISGRDKIDKYAYLVGFDSFKENILYRGLKCDSPKYQILKNSAEISLFLYKDNLKIEEILEKTGLSRYQVIMALKRMYNLKIISKKRYTNRNKWIYSLSKTNNEFLFHCMKLVYNKINENIYEIPLRKLSNLNYQDYVYDLSVDKKSPNFITDGFILVHNSTRANILETLYNRNYIKDKQIKATELGIRLIDSLRKHSPIIIDEELTRNIEKDMDSIRNSKKELDKKEREVINKAEEALKDISKDFKKKEGEIGKELVEANQALWDGEKENNKLDVECPSCKTGRLALKYTPRFKSYFVACDNYPKCKQTYSLPKALIKNTAKKNCEECSWPMLLSIKKARKPWVFCFNPECPSKRPLDINGDDKKPEERYVGNPADVHRKKIADIERVDGSQKI